MRQVLFGFLRYSNKQNKVPVFQKHIQVDNSHNQFGSVQLLSRVWLFATPWTAARQPSLSISNSWSLLRLMSIELVMPSNHLILWDEINSYNK